MLKTAPSPCRSAGNAGEFLRREDLGQLRPRLRGDGWAFGKRVACLSLLTVGVARNVREEELARIRVAHEPPLIDGQRVRVVPPTQIQPTAALELVPRGFFHRTPPLQNLDLLTHGRSPIALTYTRWCPVRPHRG